MTLSFRSFLLAAALGDLLVVAAAWLYTSLMPMRFLESGYPIWVAKQAMLQHCDFGSILVLGDLRAELAIVPAQLPSPAANVTFGGTTPDETYFFAREALSCPHPPQLVIYSHSMQAYLHPNPGIVENRDPIRVYQFPRPPRHRRGGSTGPRPVARRDQYQRRVDRYRARHRIRNWFPVSLHGQSGRSARHRSLRLQQDAAAADRRYPGPGHLPAATG